MWTSSFNLKKGKKRKRGPCKKERYIYIYIYKKKKKKIHNISLLHISLFPNLTPAKRPLHTTSPQNESNTTKPQTHVSTKKFSRHPFLRLQKMTVIFRGGFGYCCPSPVKRRDRGEKGGIERKKRKKIKKNLKRNFEIYKIKRKIILFFGGIDNMGDVQDIF